MGIVERLFSSNLTRLMYPDTPLIRQCPGMPDEIQLPVYACNIYCLPSA